MKNCNLPRFTNSTFEIFVRHNIDAYTVIFSYLHPVLQVNVCAATVSRFRVETALHVLTTSTARVHRCVVLTVDPSDSLLCSSPSFSLQQGLPTSILDRIAWVRREAMLGRFLYVLQFKMAFHFRASEHIPKFGFEANMS